VLYAENSDNELIPAKKGIFCTCPDCGEPVIPRCGIINDPHFAHHPNSKCGNEYYDTKSPWHREWQRSIENPTGGVNVEVDIQDGDYKKRADLVTKNGLIIEFQKSHLPLAERLLRENHFKDMVWVIHKNLIKSKTWVLNPNWAIPIIIDNNKDTLCCHRRKKNQYNPVCSKTWFVNNIINGKLELASFCDFINEINTSAEKLERRHILKKILKKQAKEDAVRKRKEESCKRQQEKFFKDPESLQVFFRLIAVEEDEIIFREKTRQLRLLEQLIVEHQQIREKKDMICQFKKDLLSKGYIEIFND
jgi:competence CoiA-like predicted nuclease